MFGCDLKNRQNLFIVVRWVCDLLEYWACFLLNYVFQCTKHQKNTINVSGKHILLKQMEKFNKRKEYKIFHNFFHQLLKIGCPGKPATRRRPTRRHPVRRPGGRTRFPTLLTRHPAGRLSVFQFKTRETRPEPKFMQYPAIFSRFWPPFSLKSDDFWYNKHRI